MKATYITHACILLDLDGLKILTDPWLVGPCWGGDLWHFPTHKYSPKNLPKPDIIFFSHGHEDHYHEETLKNFPKDWFKTLVVVPKFKETFSIFTFAISNCHVSALQGFIRRPVKNYSRM